MENGSEREDFVQFEELDKPRRIRFDTNAVCDFSDAAGGRSITDVLFGSDRLSLGDIRLLLWAGLKWEDKRLTKERVGILLENFIVEGGTVQDLADSITEAVNKSRLFNALSERADPNSQGGAKTPPTTENGSPDNG